MYLWEKLRCATCVTTQDSCGDPEGTQGVPDPPPPPEKSKNIGFLSKAGPVPLKITKLPNQHSMLGHHRHASECHLMKLSGSAFEYGIKHVSLDGCHILIDNNCFYNISWDTDSIFSIRGWAMCNELHHYCILVKSSNRPRVFLLIF